MNKKPEEIMSINVENTDEIRWSICNGHLTIQTLNKGYRSAHIEPINHMKDPVRATMVLLELCASEMDKGVKIKHEEMYDNEMVPYNCRHCGKIGNLEIPNKPFKHVIYHCSKCNNNDLVTNLEIQRMKADVVIRKSGRYPWKHEDSIPNIGYILGVDRASERDIQYMKDKIHDDFVTTNPFIFNSGKDVASIIKEIARDPSISIYKDDEKITLNEIREGVGVIQVIPDYDKQKLENPWRHNLDVIIDRLSEKGLSATDISEVFDGVITDNERYKLRCVECGQVAKCVCGSKRFKSVKESEDEPKKVVWRLDVYDEYEGWRNALGWYSTEEKAKKEMEETIAQWDQKRLAQTTIQYEIYEVEVD